MPKPTDAELEIAERRVTVLNAAETQAWDALARAVDRSRDFATRRREGEHAASLFTCVAAIMGQPTMPTPGDRVTSETNADIEGLASAFLSMTDEQRDLIIATAKTTTGDT